MFTRLINRAKGAADHLVLKYLARASVAIPIVIALGFVFAALTVTLVQRFGHVDAYWIMTGSLVLIGILAAVFVSAREHEEEIAERKVQQEHTHKPISDAAAQAVMHAPVALFGALLTTPSGSKTALKTVRLLGRNYPLLLLLVMIGALFSPGRGPGDDSTINEARAKPNAL